MICCQNESYKDWLTLFKVPKYIPVVGVVAEVERGLKVVWDCDWAYRVFGNSCPAVKSGVLK